LCYALIMKDRWKQLDLQGGGLQSVNQAFVARRKRRALAYLGWLAFPLGGHRLYLGSRRGAWAFSAATAIALSAWLSGLPWLAWTIAALELGAALFDLIWIDRRITELDKALKMQAWLGAGATPPQGYQGREIPEDYLEQYRRAKEKERPAERKIGRAPQLGGQHVPSFREQERLLRELARRRTAQAERSNKDK